MSFTRSTALTIGAGGAALLGYSTLWERTAFRVRRVDVPVLPPGSRPLRLLHVSDAHLRPGQYRVRAFLADLPRLLPDLIILTGDTLGDVDAVEAAVASLLPLTSLPGVFVPGNNDYYAPQPINPLRYLRPGGRAPRSARLDWPSLAAALTDLGWLDLTHVRRILRLEGAAVELRGVDDAHLRRDRLDRVAGPPPPGTLGIGLTHTPEPRVLDAYQHDGVALTLAGHTHGGQVRIPRVGALLTNCGLDRSRARGLSRWPGSSGGMFLHVSAGLGTSRYAPLRLACPPEVTLLTLTEAEGGGAS